MTLLTSSGHFVATEDPKPLGVENMTQAEAEARVMEFLKEAPVLSEIPFDTDAGDLMVRHGGYDVRAAQLDPNVSFPYEIMQAVQAKGWFAGLTKSAYSFVGACSQNRLIKKTLPGWVKRIRAAGADAAVLVPV